MSATPITQTAANEDFTGALAKAPLLNDLSDTVVKAVCEVAERRRYDAGQTVYAMGQFDGGEFVIVLAGQMRVSIMNPETGAIFIEDIGAEAVFALEFAMSGQGGDTVQQLSVMAQEDLIVAAIDADAFRALAGQRPSLMRNTAVHFAKTLSAQRFKYMSAETAPSQRVFSALLKFVERDGVTGEWRVPRMPKHRVLADSAGVDETVTAEAVATLIQEGVARREYPGLVVNDLDRLTKLAG